MVKKNGFILLTSVLFLFSCNNKEKQPTVEYKQDNGQSLSVDLDESTIYWVGSSPNVEHKGSLKLKEGVLYISDDEKVKLGGFTIDMNSIECTNVPNEKDKQKLEKHLKSRDFFNVSVFPDAKFTITRVDEVANNDSITHKISGILALKSFERGLSFDAKIVKDGNKYVAKTLPFYIDRIKWDIIFGSNTIYPEMKKNIVNDKIGLVVEIVAYSDQKSN